MKVLDQGQMNHVSGAGIDVTALLDYKNHESFTDYLVFMSKNHFDPLSTSVPGLRSAYKSWCTENGLDASGSAKMNGWSY